MSHGRVECQKCGDVIRSCRCFHAATNVTYETCESCSSTRTERPAKGKAAPVIDAESGVPADECEVSEQDLIKAKAKELQVHATSQGATRPKRPYGVEKYMYQFMAGQGEGRAKNPKAYTEGWERIFGSAADSATDRSGKSPKGCDTASHDPDSDSERPALSRPTGDGPIPVGSQDTGHLKLTREMIEASTDRGDSFVMLNHIDGSELEPEGFDEQETNARERKEKA